ncbi:MAG: hypothetical protein HYU28_11075 [Actinobacteria bacterium]|nr:hypothetical protein [Actinomycetota bacterium]
MRRLTAGGRDERGVVTVIVALLLVVLLGMGAYVIDIGALYQERRELQNGADAGALAIAQECAEGDCGVPGATATQYADANAEDGASAVDAATVDLAARTATVDTSTEGSGGAQVPFRFAQVFGRSGQTVHASATAQWGPALNAAAVPLTFSLCEFEAAVGDPFDLPIDALPSGEVTITFHDGNSTEPCNGPAGLDVPGGFGWLDESGCLAEISVDEGGVWVDSNTGVAPAKGCSPSDFPIGTPLLFPIFDDATGTGANAAFRVVGYAAFEITAFKLAPGGATWTVGLPVCAPGGGGATTTTTTAPKGGGGGSNGSDEVCITGRFVDFFEPDAELGGPSLPNFGVQTAALIK